MSRLALVASVASVMALLAVGFLLVALRQQVRSAEAVAHRLAHRLDLMSDQLADAAAAVEELRGHTLPLLADTRSALRRAEEDKVTARALIESATRVTERVDRAGAFAQRMISTLAVKVAAFLSGSGRAAHRLREVAGSDGREERRITRQIAKLEAKRPSRRRTKGPVLAATTRAIAVQPVAIGAATVENPAIPASAATPDPERAHAPGPRRGPSRRRRRA